ncbi:MAG: alpha/beta hydrolase [Bacteroidota bacterium]
MKTFRKTIILFLLISIPSLKAQEWPFEVAVQGKGSPVLLFPGFSCTGAVWDDVVASLSQNYECHVFTFAGFGEVPAIETPWLLKIKEGIENYVEKKELQEVSIIGHSLGGALGLWLASSTAVPYKNLVVVDALPSTGALMIPNFKSEDMVYDNPYNQNLLAMGEEDFDRMATQMATMMTSDPEARVQISEWMKMADRKTYVYGYTDLLKLDLRETIAEIKVPVTVLAAAKPYGVEMARKIYEEQYKNLSGYELRIAENSAHFIMYDDLEWLLGQISQQLP